MESALSLQQAIIFFSEFENCRKFMVELRWPEGTITCPRCGSDNVTWLAKARVWKCYSKHERPTFTLKTGTIFEESPIPLEKWLPAAWLVINCKNGISSYELSRALDVTQKSAWFMLHRVRLAMQNGSFEKLSGIVEADETFIGGKKKLMNNKTRSRRLAQGTLPRGGMLGKAIVMGLLERHGEARVKVLDGRKRRHIAPEINKHVAAGSSVFTDQLPSYDALTSQYAHEVIDHTEAYGRDNVHTNGLENFWSLFKRALKGMYVSVEPFHLQAYADEQCFRFNNRKMTDAERFALVMTQIIGRRLTYNELTGKTESHAVTRP
ncbi:MAG TPA: IS1595 family transposase [Bryobacteraceae bacterium]|jgi:transposase-like protein|nr:IS1595 family transposase [Bryobacteraceae bacterium]